MTNKNRKAHAQVAAADNEVMATEMNRRLTLAMTGASGSVFAAQMLRMLVADERVERVDFVPTESALRVLAEELGVNGRVDLVRNLLGDAADSVAAGKVKLHADADIGASIASGSYPSWGMIVLPCSMGTLAGIAHGMASGLVERAADVCLKERRRLVLCVRETPFNLIHLHNMTAVTEAGATVYPVMPTLYDKPDTTATMALQFVQRVLGYVGLPQDGAYVWRG
jgi:4-hydroxy-3-polyprenylbenzoate decarboxylase